MNIKRSPIRWLIATLLAVLISTSTQAESFANIIVFGDSLSDNGNLATLPDYSFLNNPPFNKGFTNGKFAVEVVAKLLKLEVKPSLYLTGFPSDGTNFAVAGARAGGETIIDLSGQVQAFLLGNNGESLGNTLYFIMIGGNDIADAVETGSPIQARFILGHAVQTIGSNINALLDAGAKSLMVVNAPNIGITPRVKNLGSEATHFAKELSKTFNRLLKKSVKSIEKNRGIDIGYFNLYGFVHQILTNHTALGFKNVEDACYDSINLTENPGCKFEEYFFFDEFHPTAKANQRIGYAMRALAPEADN